MRLGRFLFRQGLHKQTFSSLKEKFGDWFLNSKNGFRFRILLLTAPVVGYPIGAFLVNGPFINKVFRWRYDLEEKLPEHLQKLFDEVCLVVFKF